MKRLFIVCSLGLAIGVSMVSGTAAKYTQTLEEQHATVTAKTFRVHSKSNESFTDFSLALGEEKEFIFTVTNTEEGGNVASEIGLDANFVLERKDKSKGNGFSKNVEVRVESKDFKLSKEKDDDEITLKDKQKVEGIASFNKGKAESKVIKVKVKWDVDKTGNMDFKKIKEESIDLALKISATQNKQA